MINERYWQIKEGSATLIRRYESKVEAARVASELHPAGPVVLVCKDASSHKIVSRVPL